jgi:hypothetical protein
MEVVTQEELGRLIEYKPAKKDTVMRPYQAKDIPFLIAGTQMFVPLLPQYEGIKVDPKRVEQLLSHNLGNQAYFQCWVLCDPHTDRPVGCGAGVCNVCAFNYDVVAQDVFLFVLPNWRSLVNLDKLMTAYKKWALARGATIIQSSQTGGYRVKEMNVLMRRKGYVEVGPMFHLRMDDEYLKEQLKELTKSEW